MATISLRNINPARFDYDVHMMSSVGIGTVSPGGRLTIAGNSDISDSDCRLDIIDNDATSGSSIPSISLRSGASTQIYEIRGNDTLGLQFRDAAGATRITFDPNGEVGIGTEIPNAPLTIEKSSSSTTAGNHQTSLRISNKDTTVNNWASIIFDSAGMAAGDMSLQYTDHTNNYGNISFSTRGALGWGQRLIIMSTGKIGIGTTSPSELLEVSSGGTSRIRINSGDSGASSVDLYDNGSLGVRINCDSTKNLELMAGGRTGADLIILASNGNVGIGTTSPSEPLTIRSSSENVDCVLLSIGNDVHVTNTKDSWIRYESSIGGSADRSFATGTNNGLFKFVYLGTRATAPAAGTDLMTISSVGKVGIGTATPDHTLDVAGDIGIDAHLFHNGNGNTYMHFGTDTWKVRTAGTDRLFIGSTGLVGIGQVNPAYMLDVNGTIRCNTLIFADGTSFSSVGQVGMKAIAVNVGNGSSNVVVRAQSIVNASYGGIQNGMVVVYYHWYYTYGCGNSTCGATAQRKDFYQVVNGTWTLAIQF